MTGWHAWDWDLVTIQWVVLGLWFLALETYTLVWRPGQEATAHIRPLFLEHPLTWFLALGLWLWLGIHFLVPVAEAWLREVVGRY